MGGRRNRNAQRNGWRRSNGHVRNQPWNPRKVRVVCPTGKVGLPRAEAERKLDAYSTDPNPRRATPCRVYECPRCGWWHLTSKAVWTDARPPT
jgi:hypothetical protein